MAFGVSHFFSLLVILLLASSSSAAVEVLFSGQRLLSGRSLVSGTSILTMRPDCNLVLFAPNPIWSTRTSGAGVNCYASMQFDGKLVVYTGAGRAVWSTGTNLGNGHYIFVLRPDRNLVIYGPARWASGTIPRGMAPTAFFVNGTITAADAGKAKP